MAVVSTNRVMKRTTIMLPGELRRRAARRAKERGVSLGVLVRESLDSSLPPLSENAAADTFFADRGVFGGKGPRDLARDHDRYLYETSR